MKYLKYFESMEEKEIKVLILIFLLEHGNPKWLESIETFKSLDVNWWVKPQGASHLGLAYQSILDTDDLDVARRTAEYIESEFDFPILICLSRENISRHEPVGESNDKGWWKIGRAFDKMISEGEKGIHII
jgi:hypothetical protein